MTLGAGASSAIAENRRDVTRTALDLYHQGDFQQALQLYSAAGDALPTIPELEFNKGVTQAQLGDLQAAQKSLDQATLSRHQGVAGDAHFNLGNAFYEQQQFDQAIESYKNALRADPSNTAAKRNLELALRQKQEQQEQQQEQQDQQDQQQDENEQEQQDQQNQDQQQQEQEQDQEQQQQQQQPDSTQQKPDQQQQPQPDPRQMSKEDAERILNALKDEEMKHQKNRRLLSPRVYLGRDW